MNIGLLISRFPPDVIGGSEIQIQQVAFELAKRGHQVTVFTRGYAGNDYSNDPHEFQIRRRTAPPIPVVRLCWDAASAVWSIARQRPRPEVLLCYEALNSGFFGVWAQTILGIPAVVSIRGNEEYRLRLSFRNRALVPGIYRRARRLMVQSPRIVDDMREHLSLSGKQKLTELIQTKVRVIPNGIGLHAKERSAGTKVVYTGRLIRNKGIDDLLHAMKEFPEVETVIVGDGPERQRLESLAAGTRTQFVGSVEHANVADYLMQARILALPTHFEGFPNAICEAMAFGVPVVTTRSAGISDLVGDNETGLLCEPGDIPQLTKNIGRLLYDDELWNRLGERGMEVAKKYTWEAIAPQIEELLREAIGQNSALENRETVHAAAE